MVAYNIYEYCRYTLISNLTSLNGSNTRAKLGERDAPRFLICVRVVGAAMANEMWKFVQAKSKRAMKQVRLVKHIIVCLSSLHPVPPQRLPTRAALGTDIH